MILLSKAVPLLETRHRFPRKCHSSGGGLRNGHFLCLKSLLFRFEIPFQIQPLSRVIERPLRNRFWCEHSQALLIARVRQTWCERRPRLRRGPRDARPTPSKRLQDPFLVWYRSTWTRDIEGFRGGTELHFLSGVTRTPFGKRAPRELWEREEFERSG
jgi:hypothetical protein